MRKPANLSNTSRLPGGYVIWAADPVGLAPGASATIQIAATPTWAKLTDHLIITPEFGGNFGQTLSIIGNVTLNAGVVEYWISIYNADPAVTYVHPADRRINWLAIPQ